MWGCIGYNHWHKNRKGAPSLYVRVYRPYSLHQICRWRSLIICEGVSELKKCYEQLQGAPSLYVRVYRSYHWFRWHLQRSLIICEGVSATEEAYTAYQKLPHYMWGCIAEEKQNGMNISAPSLYVRVYPLYEICRGYGIGSLIICEGVSVVRVCLFIKLKFPHYMWGCIPPPPTDKTARPVPSLYVRVYL